MKTIILILAVLTVFLLAAEDIKNRDLEIRAWRNAAASITEKNKTATPADLKNFLQVYETAQEIAGRYSEKKKWYVAEKNENSIRIHKGSRRGGGENHILYFPKDLYRKDYRKLEEGMYVAFNYNNGYFNVSISNPAELLQPIMLADKK